MKKLLTLFGAIGFTVTPVMTVIACGPTEEQEKETPDQKVTGTKLSDTLKVTDLGQFSLTNVDDTGKLKVESVLSTLAARNGSNGLINTSELVVGEITTSTVKVSVKADSTVYQAESFNLNYAVNEKADIASMFATANLGEFEKEPTNAEILAKVKELNPLMTDEIIAQVQIDVNGLHYGDASYRADVSVKDTSTGFNRSWVNLRYTVKTLSSGQPVTGAVNLSELTAELNTEATALDHHPSAQELLDLFKEVNKLTEEQMAEIQVVENGANGSVVFAPIVGASHVVASANAANTEIKGVRVNYKWAFNITNRLWFRDLEEIEGADLTEVATKVLDAAFERNRTRNTIMGDTQLDKAQLVEPVATDIHQVPETTTYTVTIKVKADGTYPKGQTVAVYFTWKAPAAPATPAV